MIIDFILLFIAGLVGGVVNAIAGGGSFITFPALVFIGIPPLVANATNTFASCAGYLSGVYAFRHELTPHKKALFGAVIASVFGGAVGAFLLLRTPEASFEKAIPWLLLLATLLFVFGAKANRFLKQYAKNNSSLFRFKNALLALLLFAIGIYGGFFNAGLGIVVLSYLTLCGYANINVMNGIKLVVSSAVSLAAICLFIFNDSIAWLEGSVVLVGTVLGGYFSAHISMKLSQQYIRLFVVLMSSAITAYFFYINYA